MLNKIKKRFKYFKNIKNGTSIPIFYCAIDITKPNDTKNCTMTMHPNISNQLSVGDKIFVESCLKCAIDKIRDNVDFSK